MFYLKAKEKQHFNNFLYQLYSNKCLQIIAENISGIKIKGFAEIVGVNAGEVDNRTGDEIAAEVVKKAGLKFKTEGEATDGFI